MDFARLLIARERRVRASLGTLLSFEPRWSGPSEGAELSGGAESKGVIRFTTTLFLDIGGITRRTTLYVMNLGNENVILGLPWLKDVNPVIDWTQKTLSIKESLDQSQELFCSFSTDTKQHESHFV